MMLHYFRKHKFCPIIDTTKLFISFFFVYIGIRIESIQRVADWLANCSMDACLSSTLNRASCMMSFYRHQKIKVVSCRATMQCGEKWTINFHEVLSRSASVSEIKKAYRKMALQYHPDVCDSSMKEESTKMFVELQEVYRSLTDQALGNDYSLGIGLEEKQSPERTSRSKWESQLFELNKRSQNRRLQKDGSWGCRMRARFIYP